MENKILKARANSTGKLVKVRSVSNGYWEDVNTGEIYKSENIFVIPRRHMVQIGLRIWRLGFYIFGREYLKYNNWYVIPGVSVSSVNGYDRYFDLEIKFLFVGLGFRIVLVKQKNKK